MYSQNQEEQTIRNYFGASTGVVMDIGCNDGKTLSNSLACIERGWGALLVEPSKTAYDKACVLHKTNLSVEVQNVAVSDEPGEVVFYESGTHLKNGDTSLLSSIKKESLERWAGTDNQFTETKCRAVTVDELLQNSQYKRFDLISIDAEGVDWEILQQLDLTLLGCKMLIIETNGEPAERVVLYCQRHGMKLYDKSPENLIFVR